MAATLADRHVRSQEELARLLNERGVPVTQATLSRDLEELGAVRVRAADGSLVYALPGEPGGPGSPPGGVSGSLPGACPSGRSRRGRSRAGGPGAVRRRRGRSGGRSGRAVPGGRSRGSQARQPDRRRGGPRGPAAGPGGLGAAHLG